MAERRKPTTAEIRQVRDAVDARYRTNPRKQDIMKLLFRNYGDGSKVHPQQATEVGDATDPDPEKDLKVSMRQYIGRMRRDLISFFDSTDGNQQPWRVEIEHESRGYFLDFSPNDNQPSSTDFLARFWEPYRNAGPERVRLIYAEPQFFRDSKNTYFRHRDATDPHHKRALSYLKLGKIKPTSSFVQAGVVRAMLDLFACLERLRIPYAASPTRWGQTMNDHAHPENLIVLGTGSSNPLISTLEEGLSYRTMTNGVAFTGEHPPRMYKDKNQEDLSGEKFALLTRTPHHLKGRVITILTAEHGRTVHALTEFLTRDESLAQLAEKFGDRDDPFPEAFQALFRVEMVETNAEPHIKAIEPLEVITIRGDSARPHQE